MTSRTPSAPPPVGAIAGLLHAVAPVAALCAALCVGLLAAPGLAVAQGTAAFRVGLAAARVDVALVLAVDASQSMDEDEQTLQREGYVGALTAPEVMAAIRQGRHGRIAVVYFEWGSVDQQVLIAPWTIIDGPQAARDFAARIGSAPLNHLQRTSISAALAYADELIARSGIEATRAVVDISGDGPNNQGPVVTEARDRLLRKGITINGLPIVMKDASIDWSPIPQLDRYFEDCVIGGENAFAIPVHGMNNFGSALKMKLITEIAGLALDRPRILPAAGKGAPNCRYYE